MSATSDQPEVAEVASQAQEKSEIVGRYVFYNHSRFDDRDPAANAADDRAIAPDKQALLPGQKPAYVNYTGYSAGINGIMVDIAGLAGVPTASDFVFQIGIDNDPSFWTPAPEPTAIVVRPGAGVGGSSRITITWADNAIENTWLQVNVRPTANTGLEHADVFFFGNLIGSSGTNPNSPMVTFVDAQVTAGKNFSNARPAPLITPFDYDRDGLVNRSDELIARNHLGTFLPYIAPTKDFLWAEIAGRHVFHNDSPLDGNDPAANADDDLAIDATKQPLLPGGIGSSSNYIAYGDGINGIIVDIWDLGSIPTASDFRFQTGNVNDLNQWGQAPDPTSISVRFGEGVGGSDRVTLIWEDGANINSWLQVTVKATPRTRLAADDVFYFGSVTTVSGDLAGEPVPTTASSLSPISPATATAEVPTAIAAEAAFVDFVDAGVVGRHVIYNNSQFDGNDPSANAADDAAIAPDKAALLPGQTASFVNYTSYTRGINGIVVDIAGLPDLPSVDDFEFRVGNSSDFSQWVAAPAPTSVTMRHGAGINGSSRITIVWPDGWIRDTWLQVTVKATPRTGLKTPDVFYFGNLVGESGDEAGAATVKWPDLHGAHINPTPYAQSAFITSRYDYNRDTLVNATDELSTLPMLRELRLITAPELVVEPAALRQRPELFAQGDANYAVSFAPALSRAVDGTLLAFAQGRWGFDDHMSQAIILRRSTDNGVSWSATETIFNVPSWSTDIVGPPAPIVDEITGEIFMLITVFTPTDSFAYVISSTDHGLTWSQPEDVTNDIKVTAEGNPNPAAFPNDPWGWIAIGPGHGIQINNGPYAGRLIIAGNHRLSLDRTGASWSHVIYSDDHGQTWQLGGGLDQTDSKNNYTNEATLVETADGSLYMSMRINNASVRGYSRSDDGGMTWTTKEFQPDLATKPVQGTLLRVNDNTILFSAPDNPTDPTRRQMTIWVSQDDGATWSKEKAVTFDYAGYSDMVLAGPDTVLIAYNGGHTDGFSADYISLARFNLNWLLNDDPYQFTWYFNEQAPGTAANTQGTTIQDASLWDIRSGARADSPAEAPLYVAGTHAGDSALALTKDSDYVMLAPPNTEALQFADGESFSVELVMRTTDSDGVIIGTLPDQPGWTLRLTDGFLEFSIRGTGSISSTIGTIARINDGAWHRITVIRDATGLGRLSIHIDGFLSGLGFGYVGNIKSLKPVTLGAYNDGSQQLAFEIDTLRITRAALAANEFLTSEAVAPPRFESPGVAGDAPTSIDGLQLWLPAYDPAHYFSGLWNSDPLPLNLRSTTAVQSAYDASGNGYKLNTGSDEREVFYAYDPLVGANWRHDAAGPGAGNPWIVQNPDNAGSNNFDFVQNTGAFTLSMVIKPGTFTGKYMSLMSTNRGTLAHNGFYFNLQNDGSLGLLIAGPNNTSRVTTRTAPGLVEQDVWYHVAVVGNGPGQPVTFYVTPITNETVSAYQTPHVITGQNGTYPTSEEYKLTIGATAGVPRSEFQGNMVDQAIYDRALSFDEIQQLFDYTKKI